MDEKDLKNLRSGGRRSFQAPGWRCPDEAQLAAYVDQRLDTTGKQSVEAHVANCEWCLNQVAFLARSAEWADPSPVPVQVISQARNLVPAPEHSSGINWRWTAPLAAAACLVLAIALALAFQFRRSSRSGDQSLVAQSQPQVSVPSGKLPPAVQSDTSPVGSAKSSVSPATTKPRPTQSPTAVRGADNLNALSFRLITPREGTVVKNSHLALRWVPIPNAVFYEISVVSATGDPVSQLKTEETHLQLPAQIKLTPGAKYFVWVSANLREGKTLKSNVVSIRAQ
ncbi:MAG: anti-sigma factor family protein [Pyrinomonadaceae bacterium]